MRKLLFAAVAVFGFLGMNAQEGGFKLGAHVGLPMGDIKDFYSLNLGIDATYMFEVADKFVVGPTLGYSNYIGKDLGFGFKTVNVNLVPIAASAQFSLSDNIFLGTDLGYGLLLADGVSEGGVYFLPRAGYQTEKIEVSLGYKSTSIEGGSYSSLNLGFAYKF